jgi:hypothetical protein
MKLRIYTVSVFVSPARKQRRLAFMWDGRRGLRYRTLPIGSARKVP